MRIYSRTDVGLVRESNQDACRYGSFSDDCVWAAVCDGMGGQNGGNIASKLAVEYISDLLSEKYMDEMDYKHLYALLVDSVQEANSLIFKKASEDISLAGMGTTVELAFLRKKSLYLVHVGDSRAYILRGKKIKQVTTDHSLVQEMISKGELTPEQAKVHPNKNLITRALGVAPDIKIDFIEAEYEKGDILLLATDGLTNYLSESDILSIINNGNIEDACEHLVDKAKSSGGSDNITVALIYID